MSEVLISLKGLRRHYTMGGDTVRALDGIDLEIRRGEFVVLMGSSGSGKSTLMHLLGCLDVPTDGIYVLGDENVAGLNDRQLSAIRNRRIGFVFQQFNLLNDLSVVENIALARVYSGIDRRTRLAAAKTYAERLGLGERLRHRPSELSGGQAQRVAIARALVNEPDIILADEPTGNLDSRTGQEIMDVLFDLHARGYTILMVTHDQQFRDIGTRRILLKDGAVVEDAPGGRKASARATGAAETAAQGGRMGLFDLLRTGMREGLLAHKMRTALTMLGIVIAVTGVIAMSSFSLSSKQKQADQIRALGANLIRITDARLEGEKLSQARIAGSRGLTREDMDLIRGHIPEVVAAAAVREAKLNAIAAEGEGFSPRVIGVTGDYLQVNNLALAQGRFVDRYDQESCSRVAVLGASLAALLPGPDVLGRELLIGALPYRVVGVLENRHVDLEGLEATGAADANFDLIVPLETLLKRTRFLEMRSELDQIHLQLVDEEALYTAGTAVRRLLKSSHAGQDDFQLVVPLDLLKQKQQSQRLLDILTACVSSIALIVGGIGIMNIMLASVTERTREIGIRRAVGATRRDIRWQFLSESVLIAVTGGVLGIGLALGVVAAVCSAFELPTVVSPGMVALSVTASTATGLLFGIYPATKAAAANPVEALRYE